MTGLQLHTKGFEQRFDIPPVDVATDRFSEEGFEGVFLFVIHQLSLASRMDVGFFALCTHILKKGRVLLSNCMRWLGYSPHQQMNG